MALEDVQALHNSVLSTKHNIDGSNEATANLRAAAGKAAAGIELGLSEEETLALTSRQYRRQAIAEGRMTRGQLRRLRSQAAATLRSQDEASDITGTKYLSEAEVDPFGQDQGQYATYEPGDKQYEEQERNKLREQLDDARDAGDKDLARAIGQDLALNPEDRPEMAPKSVLTDALATLETDRRANQGFMSRLAGVFGGSAVDTERDLAKTRILESLGNDRAADARLGRTLVKQDRQRFNDEVMEANDFRADAEAQRIARDQFTNGGLGSTADEAIGRIAEIRNLGKVNETAQVIRTAENLVKGEAVRRQDGVYLDPRTNNPIAVQGPELPAALQGSNSPSSANVLNAPQTAREWVTAMRPEYREGGRVFGDYPQVDTTLEAATFANKVNDYVGGEVPIAPPRSIGEFETAVESVLDTARQKGDTMYNFDAETQRNVATSEPGIGAVMNKLRYNESGMERMANALFQLDAAARSSVNQNAKATFANRTGGPTQDVVFDAKEAINPNEGAAPIARQRKGTSIRTGTTTDKRGRPKAVKTDIVTAMSQLSDPQAAKPFIGAVAGQEQPVGRQVFRGRSPVEVRENRMAQLRSNAAKRRREGRPMTRTEQADAIQKLRVQQVQNYVAQARADRAASERREREKAITDRGRLTATPPGTPPAEPGPMRAPEPAVTPTGSTVTGNSYQSDRAKQLYDRMKGVSMQEDADTIKKLADIVARRRALG